MKILWISPFFLHPTDRGAQIRSLGILKDLHLRNEVHFAALNNPANTEGPRRAGEYSTSHTAVAHVAPSRRSPAVVLQVIASLIDPTPLAVSRYASKELLKQVKDLVAANDFDCIVCDFLAAAPNVSDLGQTILFQHNVESVIWQRHVERATSPLRKRFVGLQARRMLVYERSICGQAKAIIAVSNLDAQRMRDDFDGRHVYPIATGVDLDFFARDSDPGAIPQAAIDILFCGSMDWLPNVDAMEFFLREVLPIIRAARPQTNVTIAGRSPDPRVRKAAEGLPGVHITGDVPDMRPYLWASTLSIVPIRIGGGTRLKIYEAMAANLPVVSTTVGAEGLSYTAGQDILIADTPEDFAQACLGLLADAGSRDRMASHALNLVQSRFSWAEVTKQFESILLEHRRQPAALPA